ncbi:MAG: formylglycine-generating enzyme family protein [Verrucomicrobiae bacterium]|nr:formylglycine-generating enzyme family protein [Verrucomicrobiae bacterium]
MVEVIEPKMVHVPAGRFVMGCVEDDKFANVHELPRRIIDVPAFELSLHPIFDPATLLPLVNVSWHDAVEYCVMLGKGYRLPTEVEWEYACRAGTATPFPSGHLPDSLSVNFLYDEQGNRVGPGKLLPVGWGRPNAFGLHDMLGNVCEWVQDSWRNDYAAEIAHESMKVIRGGAWDYLPRLLRSSWRDCASAPTRRDNLGFRVARDL